MEYKNELTIEMGHLGTHSDVVFLGEGLVNAGRIYGTMNRVPLSKCVEFPITENLQVSAAMGLCLEGFFPIVVFQRMDFMLPAMDAIINHLALLPALSGGKVHFPMILRAIVGLSDASFDVGCQHYKDLSTMFHGYIECVTLESGHDIRQWYSTFRERNYPIILVEKRDWY